MHHEQTDAEPWLLATLAAGIALFLLLSPLMLALAYPSSLARPFTRSALQDLPVPRLQADPAGELAFFRRTEQERLSTYGWADQDRTYVHLPIERALSLTLERGLPGWQRP